MLTFFIDPNLLWITRHAYITFTTSHLRHRSRHRRRWGGARIQSSSAAGLPVASGRSALRADTRFKTSSRPRIYFRFRYPRRPQVNRDRYFRPLHTPDVSGDNGDAGSHMSCHPGIPSYCLSPGLHHLPGAEVMAGHVQNKISGHNEATKVKIKIGLNVQKESSFFFFVSLRHVTLLTTSPTSRSKPNLRHFKNTRTSAAHQNLFPATRLNLSKRFRAGPVGGSYVESNGSHLPGSTGHQVGGVLSIQLAFPAGHFDHSYTPIHVLISPVTDSQRDDKQ
ncbi:hypothetical protein RRG08_050837 [Elysia crispata]|uniref:Uncharacterized protein n=1 Tax=Elysia crispata TaxID=231223 RepID=A0AAE1DY42_9GAST|nr:hypothetical protein RRG08_050837 [Elysia crispata]